MLTSTNSIYIRGVIPSFDWRIVWRPGKAISPETRTTATPLRPGAVDNPYIVSEK